MMAVHLSLLTIVNQGTFSYYLIRISRCKCKDYVTMIVGLGERRRLWETFAGRSNETRNYIALLAETCPS